jgi:hypothetical protein
MLTSTTPLEPLLAALSRAASARGLSDAAWARAAGIPKESLSRLRRRSNCDLTTLARLASVLDHEWQLRPRAPEGLADDGHMPAGWSREAEERLLALAASRETSVESWRAAGPGFFIAGFAMLLAGSGLVPRRPYIELAEQLHPGISEPGSFKLWLSRSPLQAARFLPQFEQALAHAPV